MTRGAVTSYLLTPLRDLSACFDCLAATRHPQRGLGLVVVCMAGWWFVYVPIHELLHALGCVMAGGEISQLEIAPQYGGSILAEYFPFVVSGGEYAGRLSGFDTKGSDLIYLSTDFLPYLLSIVVGVPALRACTRRWRPIVFGFGVVAGLAPFYNLVGDYFEMGSILCTRGATWVGVGVEGEPIRYASIRSDDVFKLVGDLITHPESLGLADTGHRLVAAVLVILSASCGLVLALGTYLAGDGLARVLVGPTPSRRSP